MQVGETAFGSGTTCPDLKQHYKKAGFCPVHPDRQPENKADIPQSYVRAGTPLSGQGTCGLLWQKQALCC